MKTSRALTLPLVFAVGLACGDASAQGHMGPYQGLTVSTARAELVTVLFGQERSTEQIINWNVAKFDSLDVILPAWEPGISPLAYLGAMIDEGLAETKVVGVASILAGSPNEVIEGPHPVLHVVCVGERVSIFLDPDEDVGTAPLTIAAGYGDKVDRANWRIAADRQDAFYTKNGKSLLLMELLLENSLTLTYRPYRRPLRRVTFELDGMGGIVPWLGQTCRWRNYYD